MDKRVLLIGGLGLVGRNVISYLIEKNYKIICADIVTPNNEERLVDVDYCIVDINNEQSLRTCLMLYDMTFDTVVNLAYPRGQGYGNELPTVNLSDFNQNISLHLGGYFNVLSVVSKYFIDNSINGQIISISSIYGVVLPRFEIYKDLKMTSPVEYTCIKHSIDALSKYFAKYYKKTGLIFNTVSYGGIFDNQNEIFLRRYNEHCGLVGMLSSKEHLGKPIEYLLQSRGYGLNGHNLVIDDGFIL